ncbi:type II secretion system F family protein [Candidatus Cyanaurora vandensis]|uniref:type II secretion system F family protein n=1 Tax=Candidatus Cyanaurora vandensis TaxID=2714958 RepID=UPI00257A95D1|nr:type II secretion system F family protein [Candidatus Cyanaurora vandensis]
MAQFKYKVRNVQGVAVEKTVEARDATVLRSSLREQGYYVLQIQEVKGGLLSRDFDLTSINNALTPIKIRDKSIFSRQFSALINAGVNLVRALSVLQEQTKNVQMAKFIERIRLDVEQGSSLADAMRKHPKAFDNLYVAMVQAGEVGGCLDEVLERLSKLLEDQDRLNRQIKAALSYPTTVLFLAVGLFLAMVTFILPVFRGIFKQLGGELPAFTLFMLGISDALQSVVGWILLFVIGGGTIFGYRYIYKTRAGREVIDRIKLKIPLFGDLIQKSSVARFCRTFGALTRSGVPILTSLEIVRDTSGNQVIANAVDKARAAIREGGQIAVTIQKEQVFPPMATQMMSVGEETGELDTMLFKVAEYYEMEVELSVKALTSLLEPIMIVVLGGMVGSVILSMYLPMFTIFDQVR